MKELQLEYIMKCLRWKDRVNAQAIEVGQEAMVRYQRWLDSKMDQTVWSGPIDSWYRHESGKITNPWPESIRVFERMLRKKLHDSFVAL